MACLKQKDISELVLSELKYRVPDKIIIDSLRWVYNPMLFYAEYRARMSDVDKYFMHLSEASEESIQLLTVEMRSYNATLELELIAAKVLLALHEFASLESEYEVQLSDPEKIQWMYYFYHNSNGKDGLFKALHGKNNGLGKPYVIL